MGKDEVPGTAGWPVVGDKSIQFYQNPEEFLQFYLNEYRSRTFLTRIFNAPTVILCGHQETRELLFDKESDFEHGYATFLYNSYGDNLLFQGAGDALTSHNKLHSVFNMSQLNYDKVEHIINEFAESLVSSNRPIDIYSATKSIMTKLCLVCFLDLDENDLDLLDTVSRLATLHWHGIISLPVNLSTTFSNSGWNKALAAKDKLLKLIQDKIKNKESRQQGFMHDLLSNFNEKFVAQHLLLFISALIPKAFASLFTSFIYELAGVDNDSRNKAGSGKLRNVLLEVQRLHPPFLGGRRIAKKSTALGNYKIQKGYSVIYIASKSQSDPVVFKSPSQFNPDRWENIESNLFCFGGGSRECVGTHFVLKILNNLCQKTLDKVTWDLKSNDDVEFKTLPVRRPQNTMYVNFTQKENT